MVSVPAKGREARFVRVTATQLWEGSQDYLFALAELQVMVGGTNAAFGAEVSASDSFEGGYWSKKYLVDGFDSRRRLPDYPPTSKIKAKADLDAEVKAQVEERNLLVDALTDDPTLRKLAELRKALETADQEIAALPPPQLVYAVANYFKPENEFKPARAPRPVYLLARGDVKRPRDLA